MYIALGCQQVSIRPVGLVWMRVPYILLPGKIMITLNINEDGYNTDIARYRFWGYFMHT